MQVVEVNSMRPPLTELSVYKEKKKVSSFALQVFLERLASLFLSLSVQSWDKPHMSFSLLTLEGSKSKHQANFLIK